MDQILKTVVETLGVEETKRRIDELNKTLPVAGVKSRTRRYEDDDTESTVSTKPSKRGKPTLQKIILNKPRLEMLGKAIGGSVTQEVVTDFRNYLINLQSVGEYNPKEFETHITSFVATKAAMTDVEPAPMAGAGGPPPPVVKVKKEKKESRVPRMYTKHVTSIRDELHRAGVDHATLTDEDVKKNFRTYVDSLTDDDFTKHDLLGHMQAFAVSQKTAVSPPESVPELDVKDIQQIPYEEIIQDVDRYILGLLAGSTVARDKQENRWVAPSEDNDEYNIDVTFNGAKYAVGEKTQRVYRINADGVGDTLLGFVGIGKFKDMKLPKTEEEDLGLDMTKLKL